MLSLLLRRPTRNTFYLLVTSLSCALLMFHIHISLRRDDWDQGIYHFSYSMSNIEPELDNSLQNPAVSRRLPRRTPSPRVTTQASLECPRVKEISCTRLFDGDMTEYEEKKDHLQHLPHHNINLTAFLESSERNPTTYCSEFRMRRGYVMKPLSKEEEDFPLAYSIMMYHEVELLERLLRAIYRPHNSYCVHVDRSASALVHKSVSAIVSCFENVFQPSNPIDVEYTKFSSLEADLLCMRELLQRKRWKYLINLTGQEFPLQTSLDLIQILKAFNGTNSIEGVLANRNRDRYRNAGNIPIPYVIVIKGAVHIVAIRAFIEYALTNSTALKLLEWVSKTEEPDENYFSTLHHNPRLGTPGAYLGYPQTNMAENPFLARFKNWVNEGLPCRGKYVRSVCVMGAGDLSVLGKRKELFVNKFNLDFEPIAYSCLEELICNRTRDELRDVKTSFNLSYYSQLPMIWNHI